MNGLLASITKYVFGILNAQFLDKITPEAFNALAKKIVPIIEEYITSLLETDPKQHETIVELFQKHRPQIITAFGDFFKDEAKLLIPDDNFRKLVIAFLEDAEKVYSPASLLGEIPVNTPNTTLFLS